MQKQKLNPALIPIILIQLINAMGYGIIFPLMPYYAAQYNATPFIVGMLSASYAIFAILAGPILGQLSDRYGRRPWLLFSLIGTSLGFVLFGIGGSLLMLFLGRIIDGISGGNIVVAQAYVSDVTKPEDRTRTFGLMGAAFGVGFILGPALGSLLAPFGFSVPSWVAAGSAAFAAVVTFFMLPESIKAQNTSQPLNFFSQFAAIGEVFGRIELRPLLLLFGSMTLAVGTFFTNLSLVLQLQAKLPANLVGIPAVFFGIANIIFQIFLLGRAVEAFGEKRLIPIGFIAILFAGIGMFFTTTLLFTIVITIAMSLGLTLLRPSLTSLLSHASGAHEQGKVLGVSVSLDSLAQIFGPLLGGFLIDRFTPGAPGLVGAGIALIALMIFFVVQKRLPARAVIQKTKPVTNPASS
jgi:multidrug resistance protein